MLCFFFISDSASIFVTTAVKTKCFSPQTTRFKETWCLREHSALKAKHMLIERKHLIATKRKEFLTNSLSTKVFWRKMTNKPWGEVLCCTLLSTRETNNNAIINRMVTSAKNPQLWLRFNTFHSLPREGWDLFLRRWEMKHRHSALESDG